MIIVNRRFRKKWCLISSLITFFLTLAIFQLYSILETEETKLTKKSEIVSDSEKKHRVKIAWGNFTQKPRTGVTSSGTEAKIGSRSDTIVTNSSNLTLSDIFISVKTTGKNHRTRVDLLLKTWFQFAKDETYFFTDLDDEEINKKANGHLVNTNCKSVHSRQGLCCKMSGEYDFFIASQKKWFCHVDDDTYINFPTLVNLLQRYNHKDSYYLGKPSLNHALTIPHPDDRQQKVSFWFATGGAGFCLSRGIALQMSPYAWRGQLLSTCDRIRLPDDCTIGYIIYHHLKLELTIIPEFHSHLEGLWQIKRDSLASQITFSYSPKADVSHPNVIAISGFPEKDDPTRFLTIHCFLYPKFDGCSQMETRPTSLR